MKSTKPTNEDAERYLATENLLREALDYLQRLPPVPVTRDMAQRIATHLADPSLALARERAKVAQDCAERDRCAQEGVLAFLPSGAPYLHASLVGRTLTLSHPTFDTSETDRALIRHAHGRLLGQLATGVTIKLGDRWVFGRSVPSSDKP